MSSTNGILTPPLTDNLMGGQLSPPPTAGKAPATPPKRGTSANSQLLTPPSTGDFRKTVWFDLPPGRKRRRICAKDEDESALAEYAELYDYNDSRDVPLVLENPITWSPENDRLSSLHSSLNSDKHGVPGDAGNTVVQSTEPSVSNNDTGSFPFMELPLAVRNKVYKILLVIPALICVRQNDASYENDESAFFYPATRQLLPGIAYALPQIDVNGFKAQYSRFQYMNTGILRVSKKVYTEAKATMYGGNDFGIVCPSMELTPYPDYKIKLFPRDCQSYVRSLSIRVCALYPLKWLLTGGYAEIKHAYRGLDKLEIIFEMESGTKDFGKVLSKMEDERWIVYVKRLHATIMTEVFDSKKVNTLPIWLNFRVKFHGESYHDLSEPTTHNIKVDLGPGDVSPTDVARERLRRYHIKRGLPEAFELFKKGGR